MRRVTLAIIAWAAIAQIAGIGAAASAHSSPERSARRGTAVPHARHQVRRTTKHTKRHARNPNRIPGGGGGRPRPGSISQHLPDPIGETAPLIPPLRPNPVEEAALPTGEKLQIGETPPAEETRVSPSNPFAGRALYVEPASPAWHTASEWASEGRTEEAQEIERIAVQPVAKWFGDWTYGHAGTKGDVDWWVSQATAVDSLPVLVAYDLPWRDCSLYSSGGAVNATAYRTFIDEMAAGIGARATVVILEPDALSELSCLGSEEQASYYSLLSYAVKTLGHRATTAVYLDAGNSGWQSAQTMAARLKLADIAGARGFSLNISSFDTSASEAAYGRAIDSALGSSAHLVIDTSRNGQGPLGGEWCNPPGRGLGTPPTSKTGEALIDAFLWIKHPGTSDGTCNGGPSAGTWWPAQALELARNDGG